MTYAAFGQTHVKQVLAPLVGAPAVYRQLRRWMEDELGFTFGPRPSGS